jgi:peptidoglycan biosynthesis protein MviN/MurJ (putative lipid II flippase)
LKIVFASAVMGGVLYLVLSRWNLSYAPFWPRLGFVATLLGVGMAVYLLMALLLKLRGLQPLRQGLTRKFSKASGPSEG